MYSSTCTIIDEDGDLHTCTPRLRLHRAKLLAFGIDQHDPAPKLLGVASQRFGKCFTDDRARRLLYARPHTLVHGTWPFGVDFLRVPQRVDDVRSSARERRDRVYRGHLRHALSVALLAGCQARLELVLALLRGTPRSLAQVFVPHRDALARRC
jgi:hypothetical protein